MTNRTGTSNSRTSIRPMKTNGTTIAISDPKIRSTPGDIIRLSCRTSLVARAMMSPTFCRLWNVWLLLSRLVKSSSRASRSSRLATTSIANRATKSTTPRRITMTSSAIAIWTSVERTSSPPSLTASNASPVSPGTRPFSASVSTAVTRKSPIHPFRCTRCEITQRSGERRSGTNADWTVNSDDSWAGGAPVEGDVLVTVDTKNSWACRGTGDTRGPDVCG